MQSRKGTMVHRSKLSGNQAAATIDLVTGGGNQWKLARLINVSPATIKRTLSHALRPAD